MPLKRLLAAVPVKRSPTTPVGCETTFSLLPAPSVKATCTRRIWPTWVWVGVKLGLLVPTTVQVVPLFADISQVYENTPRPLMSAMPAVLAVIVTPSVGVVSLITGAPVAAPAGAGAATSPLAKRRISIPQRVSTPSFKARAGAIRLSVTVTLLSALRSTV